MKLHVGLTPLEMHDQLLASQVDGARHDASLCPFCRGRDAASAQESPASVPSGSTPSGASVSTTNPTTEGGTHSMTAPAETKTLSEETHQALLAKAVGDAVAATDSALAAKTEEASTATARVAELEAELSTVKADNARINSELDKAQLDLKSATDEVAALKEAETERASAARLEEAKATRVEQVKKLGVFTEDYVAEKASAWAAMSDEDWTARLDEWAKAAPGSKKVPADTASAMTGTTGTTTTEPSDTASGDEQPARRRVLGLT